MKNILILSVLILASSCAYKDPLFQPYIDQVIQYCDQYQCGKQQRINEISFCFKTQEKTETTIVNGTSRINGIEIDPTRWFSMNEDKRFLLIIHELGHAVWKKKHNDEFDSDSNPITIMHSQITIFDKIWDIKKEELLEEFFN